MVLGPMLPEHLRLLLSLGLHSSVGVSSKFAPSIQVTQGQLGCELIALLSGSGEQIRRGVKMQSKCRLTQALGQTRVG